MVYGIVEMALSPEHLQRRIAYKIAVMQTVPLHMDPFRNWGMSDTNNARKYVNFIGEMADLLLDEDRAHAEDID
jgi:hypothetical protein